MTLGNILITGGTGTFGTAFTRRVLNNDLAERVVILSRSEQKQQRMKQRFSDERLRFMLGDVRDGDRLVRAFRGVDVVIHAAALKHVQRSGPDFDEFFRTNAQGSLNVIDAAHSAEVARCVGLSTDKAVESVTPYGDTKAVMESAFVGASAWGPTRFCCTRYGNILDSSGSVLETWRKQIERGTGADGRIRGVELEITDVRMTRFWMTIVEAVDLVLLALGRMCGGEIFIPKGVDRSSVADLMLYHWPEFICEITGKRSYEKLHEKLVATEERDRLHDCGDVYVLAPLHVHWEPGPYGTEFPLVPDDFEYRSDGEGG